MLKPEKSKSTNKIDMKPCLTLLPLKKRNNGQMAYAIKLNLAAYRYLGLSDDTLPEVFVTLDDSVESDYNLLIGNSKRRKKKKGITNFLTAKLFKKTKIFTSKRIYELICSKFSIIPYNIKYNYDIFFNEKQEDEVYSLSGSVDSHNIRVHLSEDFLSNA